VASDSFFEGVSFDRKILKPSSTVFAMRLPLYLRFYLSGGVMGEYHHENPSNGAIEITLNH